MKKYIIEIYHTDGVEPDIYASFDTPALLCDEIKKIVRDYFKPEDSK